jgi:hypothetical protein
MARVDRVYFGIAKDVADSNRWGFSHTGAVMDWFQRGHAFSAGCSAALVSEWESTSWVSMRNWLGQFDSMSG